MHRPVSFYIRENLIYPLRSVASSAGSARGPFVSSLGLCLQRVFTFSPSSRACSPRGIMWECLEKRRFLCACVRSSICEIHQRLNPFTTLEASVISRSLTLLSFLYEHCRVFTNNLSPSSSPTYNLAATRPFAPVRPPPSGETDTEIACPQCAPICLSSD